MSEPVDLMKPWTTKSLATRVADDIAATARRENLTTGQLLEKVWDEWKARGRPAPIQTGNIVSSLAELLRAAGSLPEHMPMPREVRNTINEYARMARGLPPQKLGQTAPLEIADGTNR